MQTRSNSGLRWCRELIAIAWDRVAVQINRVNPLQINRVEQSLGLDDVPVNAGFEAIAKHPGGAGFENLDVQPLFQRQVLGRAVRNDRFLLVGVDQAARGAQRRPQDGQVIALGSQQWRHVALEDLRHEAQQMEQDVVPVLEIKIDQPLADLGLLGNVVDRC